MKNNRPRRVPTKGVAKNEDESFQDRNHRRSDRMPDVSIGGRNHRRSRLELPDLVERFEFPCGLKEGRPRQRSGFAPVAITDQPRPSDATDV